MSDPSPWLGLSVEAIGALGSAGAAIVAVTLANRERTERRRAQAELRTEQRRVQATHVLTRCFTSTHASTAGLAAWVIEVQNTSASPIREVRAEAWSTSDPGERASVNLGDIAPGTTESANAAPLISLTEAFAFDHRVHFRDVAGVQWLRDSSGKLTDLTAEFPPEP